MAKNSGFGLKEVSDFYLLPYTPTMMSPDGAGTTPWAASDRLGIISPATNPHNNIAKSFSLYKNTNTLALNLNSADFGTTVINRGGFYFDSLKVSNIEVSSEDTYAQGGKGNSDLVGWNYNKEITLTLENALLDMPTLNLMMGATESLNFVGIGRTIIRDYTSTKDHLFTFILPKCKVNIGATLTMEAEGDPTTFEMIIKTLSTSVKLNQYTQDGSYGTWLEKPDSLILFYPAHYGTIK